MQAHALVVYHGGDCSDGFTAAWVAKKALESRGTIVTTHPMLYGDPFPHNLVREGTTVYVLDFSFRRDMLAEVAAKVSRVCVLDHHKSAAEDLSQLVEELGTVRSLTLPSGDVVHFDAEDEDRVAGLSWSRSQHGSAVAYLGGGRAESQLVQMHRYLVDAPDHLLVDHRNRNTLDNRKSNLRFATKQQNAANMDRGSEFKGTTYISKSRRWRAQISVDGKNKHLGMFDTPEAASAAYNAAAIAAFGEFARGRDLDNDPVPLNLDILFDMHRSGAMLAWDHFHPGEEPPTLVRYVQDRDLWSWGLHRSKEYNAYAGCMPHSFEAWDALAQMLPGNVADLGVGVLAHLEASVRAISKHARTMMFHGYKVPVVNAPHNIISELLESLCLSNAAPFAVGWFQRSDGKYQYSLRSRAPHGIDVTTIASRFAGGGGHAQAAGFTVDVPVAMEPV